MSVNLSPQPRCDQLGSSGAKNVISCDDFFVNELFNFPQEDLFEGQENGEEYKEHKDFVRVSVSPQEQEDCENLNESFFVTDEFERFPMNDLIVPIDDLADLEWLSNFVNDSFSEHYAAFPAGICTGKPTQNELEKETKASTPLALQPCLKNVVPTKPRSKWSRIGGRVCVARGVVPLSKDIVCQYTKLPTMKIKSAVNRNGGSGTTQTTWRCSHCGVQKTPLCRAGPVGAKTLCNACGIRYQLGRLLPEYRPLCSPTFSPELHSNHHLRVLEMRQKKADAGLP